MSLTERNERVIEAARAQVHYLTRFANDHERHDRPASAARLRRQVDELLEDIKLTTQDLETAG